MCLVYLLFSVSGHEQGTRPAPDSSSWQGTGKTFWWGRMPGTCGRTPNSGCAKTWAWLDSLTIETFTVRVSNNWNIHSQSLNVTAPISFNTSNWNHPILDNQRLNLRDINMLMSTKQSPDVGYIRANKFVKLFKLTSRISRLAGYRCFGIVMRFSGIITRFSIFFLLKSLKKIHKCLFVINTKYGE